MVKYFTIKEYREFLNISQAYMSEKLGMSQAAYSKIESTKNTTNLERYQIIAKILDIDVEQVRKNRVEIIYIVCRENINCTDQDKIASEKILNIVRKQAEALKKIYDRS